MLQLSAWLEGTQEGGGGSPLSLPRELNVDCACCLGRKVLISVSLKGSGETGGVLGLSCWVVLWWKKVLIDVCVLVGGIGGGSGSGLALGALLIGGDEGSSSQSSMSPWSWAVVAESTVALLSGGAL